MRKVSVLIQLIYLLILSACFNVNEPINRKAVVDRHKIVTTNSLQHSPAQVGNGKFAFAMDITGLQSFLPFNTMSDWGWHSFPIPDGVDPDSYIYPTYHSAGQDRIFYDKNANQPDEVSYLVRNPHRINLGRIGLEILKDDGTVVQESEMKHFRQEVDMWSGKVTSRFEAEKAVITVTTVCDPESDMLGITVDSKLIEKGKLRIFYDFPYAEWRQFPMYVGDYSKPEAHKTTLNRYDKNSVLFDRVMDETKYSVAVVADQPIAVNRVDKKEHRFYMTPQDSIRYLSFTCQFVQPGEERVSRDAKEIERRSAESFENYWMSGAAVDFNGSKDPRWFELERRVVTSQYLMRVNEAGLLPPQESGLVNNGWYGRYHFEMIWWHVEHYALWNRMDLFNKYLDIYQKFLPEAKVRAAAEGRKGARWPKCTGSDLNREWPCDAHAFIIWSIPHPIYFAEQEYRVNPTQETLNKWRDVVVETARYMDSYLYFDTKRDKYVMDAPIVVVSENTKPHETTNPVFELAYWRYGLMTAIRWGERLGLSPDELASWQDKLDKMVELPTENGFYITYEGMDDMWNKKNYEHPALTGIYGWLPGEGVNKDIFEKTYDEVLKRWQFDRIWGWDFPMMAMAAARLGRPETALDMLLHPEFGFQFDEHGYATGGPFPYFPSNGGLLTTVAMMCEGWDGSTGRAPGFPKDGSWVVKYEGFNKMQ